MQYLLERCKLVLLNPTGCWSQLKDDSTPVLELLKRLYLPLAVLAALCSIVGLTVFGISVPFFGTFRPGLLTLLSQAITTIALSVAGLFLSSLVFERLAPYFGGTAPFRRSFSLLAHAAIPSLLGQALMLIPSLGVLGMIVGGLFSLYLVFCGFSSMLDIPGEKRVAFIITALVTLIIIQAILMRVSGSFAPTPTGQIVP